MSWQGLGKCLDLYYSWRDTWPTGVDLHAGHPSVIAVQLSRAGAFANKSPDFSACQLAACMEDGDAKLWLLHAPEEEIMPVVSEIWQRQMTVLTDLWVVLYKTYPCEF